MQTFKQHKEEMRANYVYTVEVLRDDDVVTQLDNVEFDSLNDIAATMKASDTLVVKFKKR